MFYQIIVLAVVVFAWYCYRVKRKRKTSITVNGQGVLITGCDTGFGHELAKRLDQLGFRVFAGCLFENGNGATKLQSVCSDRVHIVQLDITKSDDIKKARDFVEKIHTKTGCGLWSVVNNAGVDIFGDIEFMTMEIYRRTAEINLFGMINVTKTFLPMIRKSKGRVINVTSVKGRISLPRISAYGLTKYGGENFSDCLRLEMRKFGVKVSIVEPGNFAGNTGIVKDTNLQRLKADMEMMWETADAEVREVYGREYLESQFSWLENAMDISCPTMNPVIDAFEDALTNTEPEYRYLVDGGRGFVDKSCMYARLNCIFPVSWMDFLVDRWFNAGLPKIRSQRKCC